MADGLDCLLVNLLSVERVTADECCSASVRSLDKSDGPATAALLNHDTFCLRDFNSLFIDLYCF